MSDPRQQALSTFMRNLPSKWLEGAKHAVTQWPHDILHFAETPARWALGDPEQNAINSRLGPNDLHPSTEELSPFSMGSPQRGAADVTSMANPLFAPMSTARAVGRPVGAAINEAMLNGTGPLSQLLASIRPMNVVKPRGGQWLEDGVQRALDNLKSGIMDGGAELVHRGLITPEAAARRPDVALNSWVQGPLRKYILRDMATPEDPVRALAEQGITHINLDAPVSRAVQSALMDSRKGLGFSAEGVNTTVAGKNWEDRADVAMNIRDAGELQRRADSPGNKLFGAPPLPEWLKNIDPSTLIYSLEPGMNEPLGFDHITDYLKHQLDTGQLRPEQLSKVSMADAVRGTHNWNQELAANMAKQRVAEMTGMPVHKDYGDGMKWVELTTPKDLPEGYSTTPDMRHIYDFVSGEGSALSNEDARKLNLVDPQILKDYNDFRDASGAHSMSYASDFWPWLKSQPDRMDAVNGAIGKDFPSSQVNLLGPEGNHLGTFNNAEDAIADHGRTKLQDWLKQEGDTMGHCVGGYASDVTSGRSRIFSLRDANGEPHVTVETHPGMGMDDGAAAFQRHMGYPPQDQEELDNWGMRTGTGFGDGYDKPSIAQIKGKQNAAPIDKYLPYVQDFVKSGNWSDVGDLQNTGLTHFPKGDLRQAIMSFLPHEGPYYTKEEMGAADAAYRAQLPENFAQGGSVQIPTDSVHSVLSHFTNHYPEFVANA